MTMRHWLRLRFKNAWARADVTLNASRFGRSRRFAALPLDVRKGFAFPALQNNIFEAPPQIRGVASNDN